MLVVARVLVAAVPMKHWRRSLGTIADGGAHGGAHGSAHRGDDLPREVPAVVAATERAIRRIPFHLRCLPRAMTVQWMARRRGYNTTLRIGLARGVAEPLHAWVDHGGVTIIGRLPDRQYVEVLAVRARLTATNHATDRTGTRRFAPNACRPSPIELRRICNPRGTP